MEGMVSFRAVIDCMKNKGERYSRRITKVYFDSSKQKKIAGHLSYVKAMSYEFGFEVIPTSKEEIDGDYIDSVFTKVADLYHLRQMTDGPLPVESIVLICVIPTVWAGLMGYFIFERIKKRRLKK